LGVVVDNVVGGTSTPDAKPFLKVGIPSDFGIPAFYPIVGFLAIRGSAAPKTRDTAPELMRFQNAAGSTSVRF
jgi:hypothetical protein